MIHLKGCRSRYELSQQMSAHAFPRTLNLSYCACNDSIRVFEYYDVIGSASVRSRVMLDFYA